MINVKIISKKVRIMRTYLDLEQSKKLAEILPLETADINNIKK
jgi:hypothetical protein